MADIKKFLDKAGVSTLWTKVAEELNKKATVEALNGVKGTADKAAEDIGKLTTYVGTLPDGTEATTVVEYVNKKTEGIATDAALGELQQAVNTNTTAIGENADAIADNAAAITLLNGDADTVGSVANTAKAAAVAEVAAVVAGADASFDTLKEIADWIANDTTGSAQMANDIDALEALVGNTAVATQIADAIDAALKVEGVDKYALASDLNDLADRVQDLEDALGEGGNVATQITNAIAGLDADVISAAVEAGKGIQVQVTEVDGKITAVAVTGNFDEKYDAKGAATAAETAAKSHADGLNSAMDARVKVLEGIDHTKFETAGAAAQALADAKAYADTEINTKIIALTEAEIEEAINAAKAE